MWASKIFFPQINIDHCKNFSAIMRTSYYPDWTIAFSHANNFLIGVQLPLNLTALSSM